MKGLLPTAGQKEDSMAIDAIVIPAPSPEVGTDIRDALNKIGKPTVRVPTDSITIGQGETLTINGTLLVNGSLSGDGVPSGIVAKIGDLTDVQVSPYADNSILQYDKPSDQWVARPNDEFFDGSIDGGFPDTIHIDTLDIDGGFAA